MTTYDMPAALYAVANKILVSYREEPVLVLVSGGSCSGKSYFSKQLQAMLRDLRISSTIVHQDDYFRDIDDPQIPRGSDSRVIFDTPNAYHNDELRHDVETLLGGKSVTGPIYDIATNKRINATQLLDPAWVIIVDGLFAISQITQHPKAIRIFVDASLRIRLERRIKRDKKFGVPEDVIEFVFLRKIEPNHKQFVEPQRELANIIIMNEWR